MSELAPFLQIFFADIVWVRAVFSIFSRTKWSNYGRSGQVFPGISFEFRQKQGMPPSEPSVDIGWIALFLVCFPRNEYWCFARYGIATPTWAFLTQRAPHLYVYSKPPDPERPEGLTRGWVVLPQHWHFWPVFICNTIIHCIKKCLHTHTHTPSLVIWYIEIHCAREHYVVRGWEMALHSR